MGNFFQRIALVSLLLSQMISANVGAVEVQHLDRAQIEVTSRSVSERNRALKEALEQVIVKNSGSSDALSNPVVAVQLANPDTFLTQYGYLEDNGKLLWRGQFDLRRIINLLRQAHLPVWSQQRPLVLFWLSVADQYGERKILNDAADSNLWHAFTDDAQAKGLPIIFPLMDLDDLMGVTEADVRGNFPATVKQSSTRYHTDYFVLANLWQNGTGSYSYRLALYPIEDESNLWQPLFETQQTFPTQMHCVTSMVSSLTQYFVSKYAVADKGTEQLVQLTFWGINSQEKLVDLERYMEHLSLAKSAVIAQIQGNKVTFNVELFGSQADLQRQLRLDSRIKPVTGLLDASQPGSQSPYDKRVRLEYYWR